MFSTAVLTLAMVLCVQCFYLPGIKPVLYEKGDRVEIRVNTLTSLSTIVPYSYYHFPLFCPPRMLYSKVESLGEVLWGDKITSSPYYAEMRTDWKCKLLECQEDSNNKLWGRVYILDKLINEGYRGHMVVDNLPVFNNGTFVFGGRCKGQIPANQQLPFMRGYALGVHRGCIGETLVNNHLHFRFQYNQPDLEVKRYVVVGVSVTPYSVKHAPDGGDCDNDFDPTLASITPLTTKDLLLKTKPHWSYSVEWVNEPNIRWASRWDSYLHTSIANTSDRLHWVYIANNFFIIAIAIVAFMVCRHHSPDPDEIQENVPVEVCRPPPHGSALAVFVGTGTQLFFTTAFTLFFAMLGFLSPANPGGLLTTLILLFVILSFVGGNVCARILKLFELKSCESIFFCAFTYPGITFIVYVLIDLVNWNVGASTAVSFATMLTLLGLWIVAGIPLTILGASLGFRQSTIEYRVTTAEVDRESTVKWFWRPFIYIFPAVFPFCVVFLELRLILDAIWLGMSYYVFGFLVLVFIEWTIAVSLITIIVLYCQSCFEDHRWWWQSVVISGALGIVVFAYSVYYYFTALSITGATGTFLYFTYMAMVSAAFGLAAGAVGFLAAFYFARKINGSKKSESKPELQKAGGDAYDVTELVCWNVCAHILMLSDLMSWKSIFFCAFTYPGITFIVYVLIDLVNWNVGMSTAVSFDTMLTLLALWIAAGIPLTLLGASLGFRQSTIEYRVTTVEVDREWTVKWFWRPFIYIFPAAFPFCVLCLQLRLILHAIWLGMSYYVFGFLVLVFVEWTIAVSLITIIVLYCQSCFEDHRWWWQSVVISGALGIVVFAYSVCYFFTGATRTFLYFTYMATVSAAFGVAADAVGFLAAFFFARKINGSKKCESKAELRKAGGDASDVTEPPTPPVVILGVVVDEEGVKIEK